MDWFSALNNFTPFTTPEAAYHNGYRYKYRFSFEGLNNLADLSLLFQENWYHSITASILYYVLIKVIQYWMKGRKAFKLDGPLFYWNLGLAIYSIIGFARVSEQVFQTMYYQSLYDSVCKVPYPTDVAAFWAFTFTISKFVELGDTLFIVLRKRPLIFLHYYHHAAVLIYAMHSTAELAAPAVTYMAMNLFAHSFMYTYYALKAKKIHIPRAVSMFVTILQTTQMFLGVCLTIYVYIVKTRYELRCEQSLANTYLALFLYATFAYLFLDFFFTAYFGDPKPQSRKVSKKMD